MVDIIPHLKYAKSFYDGFFNTPGRRDDLMRMAKMFEKSEEMLFRKAFDMYGLILNPLIKFSS